MERMTEVDNVGVASIKGLDEQHFYNSTTMKHRDFVLLKKAFRCLADYENTQLEPNAIESLAEENKRLRFMIDNGLGWEDMINDIPDAYQPK